jgi:hypothetical protein
MAPGRQPSASQHDRSGRREEFRLRGWAARVAQARSNTYACVSVSESQTNATASGMATECSGFSTYAAQLVVVICNVSTPSRNFKLVRNFWWRACSRTHPYNGREVRVVATLTRQQFRLPVALPHT